MAQAGDDGTARAAAARESAPHAVRGWALFAALLAAYALFAVLLNSVGTVIMQAIRYYGVAKTTASTLEAFKDLSIAAVSLLLAAHLPRIGYRRCSWSRPPWSPCRWWTASRWRRCCFSRPARPSPW